MTAGTSAGDAGLPAGGPGHRRRALPLLVGGLLLGLAAPALADDNLLHRLGAYAGGRIPGGAAAQAAAAAEAALRAQAAARGDDSLDRAVNAIRRFQAQQDAARAAALAAGANVRNGLGPGGLQVADGAKAGADCPSSPWCGAALPTESVDGGRHEVTVKQGQSKAILTWSSFNVGPQTDLYFDQSAGGANVAGWIALNRILDPSGAPSRILGSLKAEGQVYLINGNGILFGGGSQVDVGTLLASTWDLPATATDSALALQQRNQLFLSGILSGSGGAVTLARDATADPALRPAIEVQAGALVTIGSRGQAVLIGQDVTNAGSIRAPDGQVLLAAAAHVPLQRGDDSRGYQLSGSDLVAGGGLVENTGMISTPRGNITLLGGQVRQDGLLLATTAADANGSIDVGTFGSQVSFGPGSATFVLPDDNGKKVIGPSTPPTSRIGVQGDDIYLAGGSTLYAPSGTITIGKVESAPAGWDNVDNVRVYVDSGARIDVSGLRDVLVPMEQNTISARLGANELRDNPVVAGGDLRGKRVDFDARLGVSGVADLSGYYNLLERDLQQVMTAGGTVKLYGREVITRDGSVIDLSGGSLRYLDGYVSSTMLADPTGRLVRIENAVAGVPYTLAGDFAVSHPRWGITDTYSAPLLRSSPRYEAGYVQGSSAGTLVLDGNGTGPANNFGIPSPTAAYRILDGQIVATTVVGPNQRDLPSSSTDLTSVWHSQPSGATLALNRAGDVTIAALAGPQLPASYARGGALDPASEYQEVLPASWFNGSGFAHVTISSGYSTDGIYDGNGGIRPDSARANLAPGGHLAINAGVTVDLGDGGSFAFSGKAVELDGTLRAPGGSVSLTALDLPQGLDRSQVNSRANDGSWPSIHLGASGTIDVAGRWTDDGAPGPRHALDGGSVSLTAMSVTLDAGSLVDVSGGARVDASGSKVTGGNGGQIAIDVSRPFRPNNDTVPPQEGGVLHANGTLSGYALGTGGSLSLALPNHVVIGDRLPAGSGEGDLLLGPDFFTRGGFSSFSLVGDGGVTVTAGSGGQAPLAPTTETLVLTASPSAIPGGARLDDYAVRTRLPLDRMAPMTLSLSSAPAWTTHQPGHADVAIDPGAVIQMVPGSTVRLSSERTVWVDGRIESDGGSIVLDATRSSAGNQFNPVGQILLGPDAELLVPGYVRTTYSAGGVAQRSVKDGGSVSLTAALDVLMDPGAVIDASGVHGIADLIGEAGGSPRMAGGYAPVPVDGNAGSITIVTQPSDRATVLAGRFRLAPGGPAGHGGTLTIVKPRLVVAQEIPGGFSVAGPGAPPADLSGLPTVSAARLDESGADNLVLSSGLGPSDSAPLDSSRAIVFRGAVDLHARRSLTLSTPVLATVPGSQAAVTLAADYVALIGSLAVSAGPSYAAETAGSLTVNAGLIDLVKSIWLGSPSPGFQDGTFASATFRSSGDIRLSDHDASGGAGAVSPAPGLFAHGDLTFDAEQVYVSSLQQDGSVRGLATSTTSYLLRSDSSITIGRAGGADAGSDPPPPLSFGGHLTLQAPTIVQGGVLRAPDGQIDLVASGSVQLLPGSLTSTSLEGQTVPFGPTLIGGQFVGYDQAGDSPTKSITIKGPSVAIQSGAVVDVSGGGDLLGWSFVPGNGGSKDLLSLPGSYAILPGYRSPAAPIGGTASLVDGSLKVGDAVYLHGVPGLADGYYTLLPAHYALLPGGRLLQPGAGAFASDGGTYTAADGSVYTSGFRAVAGTAIRDPGYSVFRVLDQATFGKYSELVSYSFNDYARRLAADAGAQVRVPYDAGSVVLDASGSLVLAGTGRFGVGQGGLLGNLDISAPEIAVLGRGQALPSDGRHYLTLDPAVLSAFGAGSTLLGGTRTTANGTTEVTLTARDVYVSTGSDAALAGPELLLGATGSVTVADGSRLSASGAATGSLAPLRIQGDGALVRLSTGDRIRIDHDGGAGRGGVVTIGNATLDASGAIALDATSTLALAPDVTLAAPKVDLASNEIDVGGGQGGTVLSNSLIQRLAASSDLLLRGYQSIHLAAGLDLGARAAGVATLAGLTLDTPLLQGDAGSARITAGRLTLRNSGGAGPAPAGTAGPGALTLDVDELVLGAGAVRLAGYASVGGRAAAIRVGDSGSLDVDGTLALATAGVRSAGGIAYALHASGDLTLSHDAAARPADDPDALGAWLELQAGGSLTLDTSVLLPAGTLVARSLAGGIRIGPQASLDLRGRAVDFQDQVRFAPGGTLRLEAAGDLAIEAGATLDVSASDRGGAAGTLWLTATGQTTVDGTLAGAAQPGSAGGAFLLDTGTLAGGFTALNRRLEAGGFTALREVRVRNPGHLAGQDLVLETGERITAHQVVLRADNDQVVVDGTIDAAGDASDPAGGSIVLRGGGGVTVRGLLDAHAYAGPLPAGAFSPAGGVVELLADGGRVDVTASATLDVTGVPDNPRGGKVVVLAPREGDDLAIDELAGTFRGARSVVLQGLAGYSASLVDQALVDRVLGDGAGWLSRARAGVLARLDRADLPLQLGAAAIVRSDGDLTLQADVDVQGRLGPGYLGFVAAGSIDVRGSVSDGFTSAARDAALLASPSSSLGFEAGTDVRLEPNAIVRTGTGDLSVLAGRDLTLASPTPGSDDRPPVLYTAGLAPAASPTGPGLGAFPEGGGDIAIRVGRDLTAPLASQSTSAWLFRSGDTSWLGDASTSTAKDPTSWSIVFPNFEQAIGALGGGDVDIRAGRDVVRLQVAIPTSGYLTTAPGQVPQPGDLVVRGGGDLDLAAGRDIVGGLFLLGRGHAELRAGGSVRPSATDLVGLRPDPSTTVGLRDGTLGVLFGLSDASASVTAGGTVSIEGLYDPMTQGQIAANLVQRGGRTFGSGFWGYTDRAAFSATSLGGDVGYLNDPWASTDLTLQFGVRPEYRVAMAGTAAGSENVLFARLPPRLLLTALEGSVTLADRYKGKSAINLAPSVDGTLELLARDDVTIRVLNLAMLNIDAPYRHGPLDAFAVSSGSFDTWTLQELPDVNTNRGRGFGLPYAANLEPARILALDGSVTTCPPTVCAGGRPTQVDLPIPLDLYAGTDIAYGRYTILHSLPTDLTTIEAGRDLRYLGLSVAGAGNVVEQAGRDFVLDINKNGGGSVVALGNQEPKGGTLTANLALDPQQAASVTILAGAAAHPDYDRFAATYLDPANGAGVVRTYLPELATFMTGLDAARYGALSPSQLVAAFQRLPLARRLIFLDAIYLEELRQTGIDYNQVGGPRFQSYDRGFRAIATLFPGTTAAGGNILLNAQPVETDARGDITLLAPYGRIQIGAESAAQGSDSGVVTRRGGDIRMMSDGDISLLTSRVFTLEGGDITMWTSNGSITAGSGASTSVVYRPLQFTMNNDAVVTVDAFGLQTGAGIGVLDALQGADAARRRSRLDLIAPRGEVNAGDAGIRVVGDINIAASVVVGVENIQVSGLSAGVPTVKAPNTVALTAAAQVTQAVAQEAASARAQSSARNVVDDLPSIITVEVVGYEAEAKDAKEPPPRKQAPKK